MRAERLDRFQMTCLLAVLALLLLPHGERLPYWLSALLAGLFGWRLWLLRTQRRLPPRWLLLPLTLGVIVAVFYEYHTLFGKSGGVALLAVLVGVKLLESRSRRDALVLVYLGYFLVITNFLFNQSMVMAVYLFAMVAATTGLLIGWHSLPGGRAHEQDWAGLRQQMKLSATLLLQAIPMMAMLFIFFPRIEGPLWKLPQDRVSARSGLADSMSPGSFSNMAQSDEVAFRVNFTQDMPSQSLLYWRGPVFEDYDGRTWTQSPWSTEGAPKIEAVGPTLEYTITLEPHQRNWLLALDMPVAAVPDTRISNHMQLVANAPVIKRSRYTIKTALNYRVGLDEKPYILRQSLVVHDDSNPRTLKLGQSWASLPPKERIDAALQLFTRQGLQYTLTPPIYGKDAVDDFIFVGKKGFCEHFAGAFVILMRSAGVPARVVGGYQGGDPNGDYLIIRQADAHAWAEVWLAGEGWVRVDPTFSVAPGRIERGIGSAVPEDDLPMMLRLNDNLVKRLRLVLDTAVNSWNQWVIGYTPEQQRKLLQRFGINNLLSSQFVFWFLGGLAALAAPLFIWLLWRMRAPKADPARQQWDRFCRKLAKAGVVCAEAEGPQDFARRAGEALPALAEQIAAIGRLYIALRYLPEGNAEQLAQLKLAVANLAVRRN